MEKKKKKLKKNINAIRNGKLNLLIIHAHKKNTKYNCYYRCLKNGITAFCSLILPIQFRDRNYLMNLKMIFYLYRKSFDFSFSQALRSQKVNDSLLPIISDLILFNL